MKIRYVWSPRTADPAEVTSLELTTEHVPRVGELVEIEIQLTKEDALHGEDSRFPLSSPYIGCGPNAHGGEIYRVV